jgi:hypothetical protein
MGSGGLGRPRSRPWVGQKVCWLAREGIAAGGCGREATYRAGRGPWYVVRLPGDVSGRLVGGVLGLLHSRLFGGLLGGGVEVPLLLIWNNSDV